ncbi:sensor histidine kinase [Luteococcus sp. OSA5]|uniref:sensor histidine kinase n=1 Tax=Luteococcus sp. OSA5 TaxID=3401630 RepID=UPI003B42F2D0
MSQLDLDPRPHGSLADRVLGSTPTQRLVRYTKFSLCMLPMTGPIVQLAPLWARGDVVRPWQAGVCSLASVLACLGALLLLSPALAPSLGGPRPSVRQWLPVAALTATSMVLPLFLLPHDPRLGWASGLAQACLAAAGPASVLTCLLGPKGTRLLLLATLLLPPTVSLLTGGHRVMSLMASIAPAVYAAMFILGGVFTAWMISVIAALDEARHTSARLAVAEERLRFGRDLHDVVGRGLSAISLKSQLAAELSRRGRHEHAQQEMAAVHQLSQDQLAEMRAVVAGYRRAELTSELAGARRLLESSGAHVTIIGLDLAAHLPEEVQEALAWTVREAATNVVRHSSARHCSITLEVGESARLTISNDGAHRPDGSATGSGLRGLQERLAQAGGRLEHGLEGDSFVLVASVGLPREEAAE